MPATHKQAVSRAGTRKTAKGSDDGSDAEIRIEHRVLCRMILGKKTKCDGSVASKVVHSDMADLTKLVDHLVDNRTKIKATLELVLSNDDVANANKKRTAMSE